MSKLSGNYELDTVKNRLYGKAIPHSYHFKGWAKQTKPSLFLPHFMEKAAMSSKLCLLCKPKNML